MKALNTKSESIYKNKSILVTGGTGSLGKCLVRRLLSSEVGAPRKVIVFSRDEAKQHEMRVEYNHQKKNVTDEVIYNNFLNLLEFRIGDVSRYEDVVSAVRDVDIIINAAALKQVPVCEYFPAQALRTNCIGAENLVRAIGESRAPVETVVGVGTDKACKPINVMGMTKALQERIFISANILNPKTRFVCVRYGNVLASRGSVIPLFHEQIRNGGPVTITDTRMTRFLLSLEDAVDTILAAISEGRPGEIFVPNAPAAFMTDVAKALIGHRKIDTKITGIRPGEKLDEELISEEESYRVEKRGGFLAIRPMLPEVGGDPVEHSKEGGAALSSASAPIDFEQVQALLARHGLLQIPDFDKAELLR